MCLLIQDQQLRSDVKVVVSAFTGERRTFTGYEIYKELRASGNVPANRTRLHVSFHVRELFNARDPAFRAYGSYPVPEGPLLFFPVPEEVLNHGDEIIQEIKEKTST